MEYKKYSKILIFDGSHALHRSISEPHLWEMRNQKGERTGGVFGTLKTIYKETKYYNYFPVVIFDGHLSKRRLNILGFSLIIAKNINLSFFANHNKLI